MHFEKRRSSCWLDNVGGDIPIAGHNLPAREIERQGAGPLIERRRHFGEVVIGAIGGKRFYVREIRANRERTVAQTREAGYPGSGSRWQRRGDRSGETIAGTELDGDVADSISMAIVVNGFGRDIASRALGQVDFKSHTG